MAKPAMSGGLSRREVSDDVADDLHRLVEALDGEGLSLDDVYQSFHELDTKNRGVLSSSIDFAAISACFATRRGRFDYESFFKRLIAIRSDSPAASFPQPTASSTSPTKRNVGKASPTKREQQSLARPRASAAGSSDSSESDAPPLQLPSMRVGRLLELQQRLQTSIRKKLLLGISGGRREGYLGVEDTLFQLDPNGDGFLPLQTFTDDVLDRLKAPLTKSEVDFLLAQLQTRGKVSEEKGVDYEQLRLLFDVDSEDSASDSGVDAVTSRYGTCSSPARVSQLGAEYLAAEKRLGAFLRSPINPGSSSVSPTIAFETPRSVFTGAERFLELAEAIDREKSGTLEEKYFHTVLVNCGVDIPEHLVLSMLSRFPRVDAGHVSYSAFLLQYGQNPDQARGRRELKQIVALLIAPVRASLPDWTAALRKRFQAYDTTLEQSSRGVLVQPEFLHILSRHCEATQVPSGQAASISRVLARLSPDKLIRYHDFLQVVSECTALTSKPVKSGGGALLVSDSSKTIAVADYLMTLATLQERQNFEQLMDLLNDFQHQVARSGVDKGRTMTQSVPNGIMLALGEKLKVQIQFKL